MRKTVYLIDAAVVPGETDIASESPELWRLVRRFNAPAQLALVAAERVAASAKDAASVALVSVGPSRGGSPELDRWLESASVNGGRFESVPRMNPVLTLHVVDNLALSGFAIYFGNRAACLGLGGAPGQAWSALEVVFELLSEDEHDEVLVMAGDRHEEALGVALLCSTRPDGYRPYRPMQVRLLEIARDSIGGTDSQYLHGTSSRGLVRWLEALTRSYHSGVSGRLDYRVPPEDGDPWNAVTIRSEVTL